VRRLYVEREDADTLVLYVNALRRSDAGQYSCESDFNGQLATQHARLTVYGQPTISSYVIIDIWHHFGLISPISGLLYGFFLSQFFF